MLNLCGVAVLPTPDQVPSKGHLPRVSHRSFLLVNGKGDNEVELCADLVVFTLGAIHKVRHMLRGERVNEV